MKIESYRDKTESLTKILFAVAVLLGALILLKIAGFFVSSSSAKMMAAEVKPGRTSENDLKASLTQAKASADELKKKNLFVLTPPKQHPVNEVIGILGDEVLINGQWYKVGATVAGAKIVAIEPTKVKIAWDGQEKEFSPIASAGAGGRPEGRPGPGGKPGPGGAPNMVVTGARGGPARPKEPGVSADEANKLRERWNNASPEERQRLREEMRQRFGGRDR